MKRPHIQFLLETRPTEKPQANHKVLVWIRCGEKRCLAHMDADGKWIDFYTGKKLRDFIKVIG